jgi:hypothetical protein
VISVKAKQELKIAMRLNNSNIALEVFCPTRTEIKQYSDRKKKVQIPLIPSILLIKIEDRKREQVFTTAGTVRYLYENGKPALVREREILVLQTVSDHKNISAHGQTTMLSGNEIDLTPYGFKNVTGVVEKATKTVCWVALKSLGVTLKLTIN